MNVHIIGGGVIGLSCAYYLNKAGHNVTIIDNFNFDNNCSLGNMGYICPSHFIPLSNPGVISKGLKWLLSSSSPFYISPKISINLLKWVYQFWKNATPLHVNNSAKPLFEIANLSLHLYNQLLTEFNFPFYKTGIYEVFQQEQTKKHLEKICYKAHELGLINTHLISKEEYCFIENKSNINCLGALAFNEDAHTYPNVFMKNFLDFLKHKNIQFMQNTEIVKIVGFNKSIKKIITSTNQEINIDNLILSTGAHSLHLYKSLDISLPLVPGRGYSYTTSESDFKLKYPAILVEGRTAITPLSQDLMRFGGTMEITNTKAPPKINRVKGIFNTIKNYYPEFNSTLPPIEKIWFGYRPCSADGLPYIGRTKKYSNLIIATGHSMVGISLALATGFLIKELLNSEKTTIDIQSFNPNRFN